ncbi:putative motility protein [Bacillus sp. REN10]|uniref:putative motility protein n=1 Tax=Bacillus sp. REN10 TaxID=2782541 RepID=UPI00193C6CFF|nr:putative motility protein [Bacillus sp. REN10]
MELSSIMGKQVAELQQTLSLNLLKSQMATQTAQAIQMMDTLPNVPSAPHPHKGTMIDIKG